MYFTQFKNVSLDRIVKKIGYNLYRTCYSFHSSYTEVAELLAYLKPEAAYANVKAPSDASLAEVIIDSNLFSFCIEYPKKALSQLRDKYKIPHCRLKNSQN
ncbi:hypothetical protein DPMN_122633 [Dreissena polymorpha]|uniref:DNA repair metallo-beta-lactamase domain-containing protein n=1 Tax=Dreissena polymorpha TaxID=45954 RepID=A0A9D4GPD6_DREPO|nr:hypothetical protein DPMN_122633 [Dreissena polymorpha]